MSDGSDGPLERRLATAVDRERAAAAAEIDLHSQGYLADLEALAHVQEAEPRSARPGWGRLIVRLRRLCHRGLFGWYTRPWLEQQNRFNAQVAVRVAQLHQRLRRLEEGAAGEFSDKPAPPHPGERP